MFGIGRLKKYRGLVDTKLNNEYQIKTKDNPLFPGVMVYLGLIDNAWKAKMSEDEGALYIATLYYSGIVKKGYNAEASGLLKRILEIVEFGISRGMISNERWRDFSQAITNANKDEELEEDCLSLAEKNLVNEFGIELDDLPDKNSVEELFCSLGSNLSHEGQTSLLYRLVVMNYLAAAKLARDEGIDVSSDKILRLTQLTDKAVDWSEMADDHFELEQISSKLNLSIMRFFESFGIRQG